MYLTISKSKAINPINEIAAISGATITSNAVTKGVNTSSEAVEVLEKSK